MPADAKHRKLIVPTLWVGLLALVVGVGLLPSFGPMPAQSGCEYGNCTPTYAGLTALEWYIIIAIVIAAVVALAILWGRARRRPPAAAAPGATYSAGPQPPGGPQPPSMGAAVGGGAVAGGAAVAGAAYVERPEDVSAPPPSAFAEAPVAAGKEQDIDSLLQELDKISGEILHRGTPPKKGDGSSAAESAQEGSGKQK